MSDTDRPALTKAPEMYVHYCNCGKWGSHGWSDGPLQETEWWCAEHYPHKRMPRARAEAVEIAEALGI